jgi:hypothetical protein
MPFLLRLGHLHRTKIANCDTGNSTFFEQFALSCMLYCFRAFNRCIGAFP